MIFQQKKYVPKVGKNVFIHPTSVVLGQVTLKDYANIWPGAVLRADLNKIEVGSYTNIQDLSLVHVESDLACKVGSYCVVGHSVILHACSVGNGVLIGMGSIILNGARIGNESLIGAGSLVTEGMKIKSGSLYFGRPAKYIRKLTKKEIRFTIEAAKKYAEMAEEHRNGFYVQSIS